ncbi:hypothetical protein B7P43_G01682, partial [Cryptotermes secundus]
MSSGTVQAHQISNKMAVASPVTLINPQSDYAPQSQQNHTQYTGTSNTGAAVGNGSAGMLQYGLHRGPKYQQQQLGTAPPTSTAYNNYTSPQMPQQQAASTSIPSSSASSSSSSYQSSLHHSHQLQQQQQQQQQQHQHQQQQQQHHQQQYAYHHPHHRQSGSSHSSQPELNLKPDQHQQTNPSKHQFQTQPFYSSSAPGRPQSAAVPPLSTSVIANGHSRTLPPSSSAASSARTGRNKRESPLDLSVKTVRQSADSTAKDDMEGGYSVPSYPPAAVDHQSRGKAGATSTKSRTPQQGAVPMPLQLPSSVAYPS